MIFCPLDWVNKQTKKQRICWMYCVSLPYSTRLTATSYFLSGCFSAEAEENMLGLIFTSNGFGL